MWTLLTSLLLAVIVSGRDDPHEHPRLNGGERDDHEDHGPGARAVRRHDVEHDALDENAMDELTAHGQGYECESNSDCVAGQTCTVAIYTLSVYPLPSYDSTPNDGIS